MSNRTRISLSEEHDIHAVAPIAPEAAYGRSAAQGGLRPCGFDSALEALFVMKGTRIYDVALDEGVVFLLKDYPPSVVRAILQRYKTQSAEYPSERLIWAIFQTLEAEGVLYGA